jgi:8-oxo-dGTP diphosphatase
MNRSPIICADVIAHYGSKIAVVRRLGSVLGLSLPGGKQESGETLSKTIEREMKEETGLSLSITGVLGTYAEPCRDPRGNYISTVFTAVAYGDPRDEPGKTQVLFLDEREIQLRESQFVFDHFKILKQYFSGK